MDEPLRVAALRKDESQEQDLLALNRMLLPVERELEHEAAGGEPSLIFVVGMARSGTTLAGQVLASAGYGYISNLHARFWLAPAFGARLAKATLPPPGTQPSNFRSVHGVTEGWSEPHEFGYFWNRWFDLGQPTHRLSDEQLEGVDRAGLRRAVSAIQQQFAAPLSFKNNTWCSLQAGWLAAVFPRAVFVVCERGAQWLAQSLLQARIDRYGSPETWWSIRPGTYAELLARPWWEQIAGQVVDFQLEQEQTLAAIPATRLVRVRYEALCQAPGEMVAQVQRALTALGVAYAPALDGLPPPFESRDRRRIDMADWQRLNDAIDRRALQRQCEVIR